MRPRHLDHGYLWRRAIARPIARLRHRLHCYSLDPRFDVIPVDEGRTGSKVANFRKNCLNPPRVTLAHIGFNRALNGRVWVPETSNTAADVQRRPQRPLLRSSTTRGLVRSLRLLVEPHQLVHQLIDAAAGLHGELLDRQILHRGDIGAEFVRAPQHRPGLAEQGRDRSPSACWSRMTVTSPVCHQVVAAVAATGLGWVVRCRCT
jgi:hypothetical protein